MHEEEITGLANDILDIARNRLLVNLRYLDTALSYSGRAVYNGKISTDGRNLCYDPVFTLKTYRSSREMITRIYLHTVLHCIFCHPFIRKDACGELWDLACDIAAESVINEIGLGCTDTDNAAAEENITRSLRQETGFLTAEKIYAYLVKMRESRPEEIKRWQELFGIDDHSMWYISGRDEGSIDEPSGTYENSSLPIHTDPELLADWKDIAEHAEMELELFAKVKGRRASALIQNLRAVNREKCDYTAFLRKFAAEGEAIRVSDDEFDYIYYNYGLTHYGRMPLIEPLEYREDRKIRDFVIAVDTSGSVAGEEVQRFLQKTYGILKQRESFDSRVNIHIIQCDARVQNDYVITSPQDIEEYFRTMEIRGLGGTDFRPVFEYVDSLIESGGIRDLKGLIYFTDGLGTYPQVMPPYKTAFVFIESGYNIPEVPVWAMRVILSSEELGEL